MSDPNRNNYTHRHGRFLCFWSKWIILHYEGSLLLWVVLKVVVAASYEARKFGVEVLWSYGKEKLS
jgi:hypothetical protein